VAEARGRAVVARAAVVVAAADAAAVGAEGRPNPSRERTRFTGGLSMKHSTSRCPRFEAGVLCAFVAITFCSLAVPAAAQSTAPAKPAAAKPAAKSAAVSSVFASAQDAVDALAAIDSGDPIADKESRARFVGWYDQKHSLQMDGDAKAMLIVGNDDWPMPIPIVKGAKGWSFDSRAGEEEILARRIGRNELNAIQVCLAFIDMQRDYAGVDRDGNGYLEYARRWISSPGKHDGLYWPTKEGEPESPGGPRLAEASVQYAGKKEPTPYHGYFYRILTAQGKNAPGGARNYVVEGKLIGGVALIAYPAKYRNSGVETFMCNTDGIVYEKDLGPETAATAVKIQAYDPDKTWEKVQQ
jgi:hypothetical protein